MDTEYRTNEVPKGLESSVAEGDNLYRRRAIIALFNGNWCFVSCVVLPFPPQSGSPRREKVWRYLQAVLFEDFISPEECLEFIRDLNAGVCKLGEFSLTREESNSQWRTDYLTIDNDYMAAAGRVVTLGFSKFNLYGAPGKLLASEAPYYPDIAAATQDWLELTVHHGYSDGRNGKVLFLLPEMRAFIKAVERLGDDGFYITAGGSLVQQAHFSIKGAFWLDKRINQFQVVLVDGAGYAPVPINSERLEYFLIDQTGTAFDFHHENQSFRKDSSLSVLGIGSKGGTEQLIKAASKGEGLRIEFKPFVDTKDKLVSNGKATKLREIGVSVIAFANTVGGHLYLGVNDDCEIIGVTPKLAEWGKREVDEALINEYLGSLKSTIKDMIHGDVELQLSHVEIDSALVIVVEVSEANPKPIRLKQDYCLYVRTGANSRKVPPDEWAGVSMSPHGTVDGILKLPN